MLVLLILRQLFESELAACIGALLFALHPVQVETVAWVSGAKDLLAGMLAMLSIDQTLRSASTDSNRAKTHYLIGLAAFTLAILAKPSGVVAPLIAGILIVAGGRRSIGSSLRLISPMLVLGVACVIWSRAAQVQWEPTHTPLWTRPLIAADAIAFYLWQLVWPIDLAIIYGRTPRYVLESGAIWWTWLIPATLTLALILARRRAPWLAAGGLVFVIGLLPVLGFARFMFQIHSTTADHYLYLSMFGVALSAAGAIARRPTVPVQLASAALLCVLAGISFIQLQHWRDSIALFEHALRVTPRSLTARGNLAAALAQRGRIEEALPHFEEVVQRSPTSRVARANLAQAYLLAGEYDAAIAEARLALELSQPGDDTAWEQQILARALEAKARAHPATTPTPPTTAPAR
jgi:tetratricopeptide (TPR) repeat protein